jgi:glyoxylase-like metal-dependent hydrolase (beta-lactamase superfamily II)
LLPAAAKGRLRQIGSGENLVDLTYVDNLIYGLILAAERGRPGTALTVTNEQPVNLWEAVGGILQELGMPLRSRAVPHHVAMIFAGVLETIHRLRPGMGEPSITRYGVGLMAKSQTFDGAVARTELGYESVVSVEEGIARTIAILKAREDAHASRFVRMQLFTTGLTRHSKHLVQRGAERIEIPFHATFALIEHPTEGITLFDTGYAPRFFAATRQFPYSLYKKITPVETSEELSAVQALQRLGIRPEQVRRIILSHFHADHICGLKDFPDADFITSMSAWEAVRGKRGFAAVRRGFLPQLLPADFSDRLCTLDHFHDPGMGPLPRAHDLFGDGSARLFELPGHAAGQTGVLLQTGEAERKFLVADPAWTTEAIQENVMPHFITRAIVDSFKDLRATLARLHDFHHRYPDVEIIPTHCPAVAQRYGFAEPRRASDLLPQP